MGKVILFGSEKGGTGKSSLATNTAAYLSINGYDCVLVDADRQKTASTWAQDRQDNPQAKIKTNHVSLEGNIRAPLLDLKERYDYVIVDCAGRDSRELRTGMTAADILISPLRPSQFDLDTLPKLLNVYEEAKDINEQLIGFLLVNQAPTNPFIKEAEQAESVLADYKEFHRCAKIVHDRKVYRDVASEGLSIFEAKNDTAKKELASVLEDIVLSPGANDDAKQQDEQVEPAMA